MTRLIDADALGELVSHGVVHYEDIMAQPTVDAVPVRHGKWISNSPVTMRCNQCTYVASDWIVHEFHYCPNCGARMDAERKEE